MSGRLAGKRILVTGGTTGIGLATAQRFVEEGARLTVTGRNPATLAEARERLGEQVDVIASDAGSASAQEALVEQVLGRLGGLDAVFINAGTAAFQAIEAIDEAEFERQFAINVKGPVFLLKALAPRLEAGASVILNASIVASLGMPSTAIYSATKGAVASLVRAVAVEWAPRGIRVNSISPGPINTPIFDKLGLPAEAADAFAVQVSQSVPLQRFGEPREIADAAVFLASNESSYISGHDLVVDGGRSAV